MFDNLDKIKSKPKNQELKKGSVSQKRKGRPFKPNMKSVQIRVDKGFDKEMYDFAKKLGIGRSQLIVAAVKAFMKEEKVQETTKKPVLEKAQILAEALKILTKN